MLTPLEQQKKKGVREWKYKQTKCLTIKCENQISKMSNLIFPCDNHGFAFSSLHLVKLFTFEKAIKNETLSMAFKAFQIIRCKHTQQ